MDIQPTILIIILLSLFIDLLFGELPSKIHPVVWMGKMIDILNDFFKSYHGRIWGMVLTIVVVITFTLATYVLISLSVINNILFIFVSSIILSTTFAINVLIRSALDIKKDLETDIGTARKNMSYLVSRDTESLSREEIVSATVETLTENITDSVTAPIFYALIFWVPGAVFYRVVNTLDAMVGYKKPDTLEIGWFPARLDDVLNYLPARITGLIMVLGAMVLGMDWKNSYRIMRRDARKPQSPNSGFTMAAAAGALGIKLKKIGYYEVGDDLNSLRIDKISEAILLTRVTILLFLISSYIIYAMIFLVIIKLF